MYLATTQQPDYMTNTCVGGHYWQYMTVLPTAVYEAIQLKMSDCDIRIVPEIVLHIIIQ